jgi:hypothetical protein
MIDEAIDDLHDVGAASRMKKGALDGLLRRMVEITPGMSRTLPSSSDVERGQHLGVQYIEGGDERFERRGSSLGTRGARGGVNSAASEEVE